MWLNLLCSVFHLILLSHFVAGDIYLHNPRGSNNRLDEKTATRRNGNRLFDSQNNNRGGYNVGDVGKDPAENDENKQYQMKYFQSGPDSTSELVIEWTNQHGCGVNDIKNPNKLNCQILLQFMCQDEGTEETEKLRDGTDSNDLQFNSGNQNENAGQTKQRRRGDDEANKNRGRHESWDYYNRCDKRERNKGLFLADQKLRGRKAKHTRQNPGGNRNGFECPEERDYYPYWHPSPWLDIAILTSDQSLCPFYAQESANVKPKGQCFEANQLQSINNNPESCRQNGGTWKDVWTYLEKEKTAKSRKACESKDGRVWALPYGAETINDEECLVLAPPLVCQKAPFTRTNHLGNTPEGTPPNFTWHLPNFPSGTFKRCVLRIRYNVSTDDYDGWSTDSASNGDRSPVRQNPLVDIGDKQKLKLAINTAQFGRTFQDRSHVFELLPRPGGTEGKKIINLNVRGKRGNIVQCYPAVEYDFIPNHLRISTSDLVHIQWTGSNTHNNGGNGGDGQAGDDGQGKGGTDRSNLVEIPNPLANFPLAFEAQKLVKDAEVVWSSRAKSGPKSAKDLAVFLASSGYYAGASEVGTKEKMNALLNDASASFEGVIIRFTKPGQEYNYMCTRNNNFSNRSQKGKIIVL